MQPSAHVFLSRAPACATVGNPMRIDELDFSRVFPSARAVARHAFTPHQTAAHTHKDSGSPDRAHTSRSAVECWIVLPTFISPGLVRHFGMCVGISFVLKLILILSQWCETREHLTLPDIGVATCCRVVCSLCGGLVFIH